MKVNDKIKYHNKTYKVIKIITNTLVEAELYPRPPIDKMANITYYLELDKESEDEE